MRTSAHKIEDTCAEIAASVAHEVRGPAIALGLLVPELTAHIEALPGRAREELSPIVADMTICAQHLARLCETLGGASRHDDAPEPLDVSEAVADAVAIARVHARGLRLRVVESYELAMIKGVRSQITQAILNLMLNAVEACRSIEGRTHLIEVTVEPMRDTVIITITDSGPGLTGRAFVTRSRQVGLGLAREGIEAHHGKLELRQDRRGGTAASVTFPRAEVREPASGPWPIQR